MNVNAPTSVKLSPSPSGAPNSGQATPPIDVVKPLDTFYGQAATKQSIVAANGARPLGVLGIPAQILDLLGRVVTTLGTALGRAWFFSRLRCGWAFNAISAFLVRIREFVFGNELAQRTRQLRSLSEEFAMQGLTLEDLLERNILTDQEKDICRREWASVQAKLQSMLETCRRELEQTSANIAASAARPRKLPATPKT